MDGQEHKNCQENLIQIHNIPFIQKKNELGDLHDRASYSKEIWNDSALVFAVAG